MLSRVAVTLYVLGRHLERAEHLARILRVHNELALDRALGHDEAFWSRLLQLAGWPLAGNLTREQAVELAVTGSAGPSVQREVTDARSAAQAVRPSLSSEVFEQLNSLHWGLHDEAWRATLDSYLRRVELGAHLISGLVDDTMAHDEAWDFIRLGKFVERATTTTRLVLSKSVELAGLDDEAVDWAAALRCCSSFEAYQQRFAAPVSPDRIVGFLLFDRLSPRSAGFCAGAALDSVRRIDAGREARETEQVLTHLLALFDEADPGEVAAAPAAFGSRFAELRQELELALRRTYFVPHQLAVSVPGDPVTSHPHQQQQAGVQCDCG
jgi:uncharacterized alpha-E superfamily protein